MDELKGLTDQELAAIKVGAPYNGQGAELALEKHVHYPQFAAELTKVLPDDVSFVSEGDLEGKDGFLKLHFSSPEVNLDAVKAVADAHEPDLNHGLTEAQVELNGLRERLAEGDLALKDINTLLRLQLDSGLQ